MSANCKLSAEHLGGAEYKFTCDGDWAVGEYYEDGMGSLASASSERAMSLFAKLIDEMGEEAFVKLLADARAAK